MPTDRFDESINLLEREFGDPEESYHVRILGDYGHLEVVDYSTMGGECFIPVRITAAGVDFVATFHDLGMWERTKDAVMKHAPAPTLEVYCRRSGVRR